MSDELTTCMGGAAVWVIIKDKKVYLSDDDKGTHSFRLPDCFYHIIQPIKETTRFRLDICKLGKLISETYNE